MRLRAVATTMAIALLLAAPAEAHPGWGIVVDREGQIYFSDVDRNLIWKVDARGKLSAFVRAKHTHEIALDRDGSLAGEHVWYDGKNFHSSSWKISPAGKLTELARAAAGETFTSVFDREGNGYFASADNQARTVSRIFKVSPSGGVTVLAGGAWGYGDGKGEEAKFRNFGALVMGPDDALYVTEGGNVRRVTLDGCVTTLAQGLTDDVKRGEPPFHGLMGIAVDPRGVVYVADYGNRLVRRIEPGGAMTALARTPWPWRPTGVALHGDDLYVLEYTTTPVAVSNLTGSPRVRKITPGGTVTIVVAAHRAR